MKDYVNLLFSVIDNINGWDNKNDNQKVKILKNYIKILQIMKILLIILKNIEFLSKNSLKNLSKDIITF